MFALKAEYISKGKKKTNQKPSSLTSFIFIDFGFLSELTAWGVPVTIWALVGMQ